MQDLFNSYNGRHVFVTGHTGFKGSWLSIILREFAAKVYGYAQDCKTAADNFALCKLSGMMSDCRGDIIDYGSLKAAMQQAQPEYVFHLAAQPLVRYSYEQPRETYMSNVIGTLNVLEAARVTPSVKVVIVVTTDKCYANNEWHWGYRECDPLGGYDPYSASKACAEILTASYRQSLCPERIAIATVRAGNVIGGGDWNQNRIVPDCIRNLSQGLPIPVRNPDAVRPWQHVLEPLFGYLKVASMLYAEPRKYEGAYNFGPGESGISKVSEVVESIIAHYGSGSWHIDRPSDSLHEATLLALDISKARQVLGWKPRWSIDEAIGATVEWYKHCGDGDVYGLCVSQIEKYLG